MKPIKAITSTSGDPEALTQNLLGLSALAAELAAEGISARDLFARTGIDAAARRCSRPHFAPTAACHLPERRGARKAI